MTRDPFELLGVALGASPTVPPGEPAGPALPLDVQARIVGGYHWVERRLFEILGSWVETEPSGEAQIVFDVYSRQHAWHAELFADRLPVSDAFDHDDLTRVPDPRIARLLDAVANGTADDAGASTGSAKRRPAGGTLLRLVGLARVLLPRLIAGFVVHQRRARVVADAPLVRAIRLTLSDEVEEWQVLESLVQTLVRRPHDVAVVTAHQARLEEFVAEGGAGVVPWPERGPGDEGSPLSSEAVARQPPPGGDGSSFDRASGRPAPRPDPAADRSDGWAEQETRMATAQVSEGGTPASGDRGP